MCSLGIEPTTFRSADAMFYLNVLNGTTTSRVVKWYYVVLKHCILDWNTEMKIHPPKSHYLLIHTLFQTHLTSFLPWKTKTALHLLLYFMQPALVEVFKIQTKFNR